MSNEELHLQLELERLRSHERHLRHIYGLRWGQLALSAVTIIIGAVMTFKGLEGSFAWAVEAPNTLTAKMTNASPGIVFATVGLILGFMLVRQRPVNYITEDADGGASIVDPSVWQDMPRPRRRK
jgi:hypothetical protein